MEQFAAWRDFGRNLNMKFATRWVIKEVKSNQKMIIALKTTETRADVYGTVEGVH